MRKKSRGEDERMDWEQIFSKQPTFRVIPCKSLQFCASIRAEQYRKITSEKKNKVNKISYKQKG